MQPGDRFLARYSYLTDRPLRKLDDDLVATRASGKNLELDIKRAIMRITPPSDDRQAVPAGLQVHELEITVNGLTYRWPQAP